MAAGYLIFKEAAEKRRISTRTVQAIRNCRYIEIDYGRIKDKTIVTRKVKPVAIMFSEYYFYLTAFIDDEEVRKHFDVINDSFLTIYRIDRIENLKVLDKGFHIPYSSRFEEGEFRKRIQFMYGGKIQRVRSEEFHFAGTILPQGQPLRLHCYSYLLVSPPSFELILSKVNGNL